MTLDLDEIDRITKAATEGPWFVDYPGDDPEVLWGIGAADNYTKICTTDCGFYGPSKPDAEFIARSRTWVPEMVAEIRAIRAKRDAFQAALYEISKAHKEWIDSGLDPMVHGRTATRITMALFMASVAPAAQRTEKGEGP